MSTQSLPREGDAMQARLRGDQPVRYAQATNR